MTTTITIAHVDDEQYWQDSVAAILATAEGITLKPFFSIYDFLQHYRTPQDFKGLDILIVDGLLQREPRRTGNDLIRRLRRDDIHLPVLGFSYTEDDDFWSAWKDDNAFTSLSKLSIGGLEAKVREFLAQQT